MAIDKAAREVRRREPSEGAQRLIDSGVMDDLFAKIDAGEIELEGSDGLISARGSRACDSDDFGSSA